MINKLICWLWGHAFDYDKHSGEVICLRCGIKGDGLWGGATI